MPVFFENGCRFAHTVSLIRAIVFRTVFGSLLWFLLYRPSKGREKRAELMVIPHQRLCSSKFPFSCWNAPDYYFKFWIFIPSFGISFQQLGIWLGFAFEFSNYLLFLHLPWSFPLRYCLLGA
jgi:hypothetical protein